MRCILYILALGIALFMTGCAEGGLLDSDADLTLDYIDSLMDASRYREAYNVLAVMDSTMRCKSHGVQMRYQLQSIKAADKVNLPLGSDSLILSIISYYEYEGDKSYLPEAYYYAGRTYASLNDSERALEYFNKALEVIDHDDAYLLSRIHSQRGYVFYKQGLYDEAIEEHLKSYDNSLREGDTIAMIHNYRDIGNCYLGKEEYNDALSYYDKGVELVTLVNDSTFLGLIGIDKASTYTYMGNLEKAEKYVKQSISLVDSSYIDYANEVAGYLFFRQKKYGLAKPYYEKLLDSKSLYSRQEGEAMLLSMAANEKNFDEALKHLVPYKELTDSISIITDSEKIARINSLYNSRQLEKENEKLERQNIRYNYLLVIGGLLVVIIVVSLLLYSYRIRSERNRLRYNNAMLDNFYKEEQLKRELAEQERDWLKKTNTMELLKHKQEDKRIFAIRESDVYQKMLHSVKAIHADDQKEIRSLLDQLYPEFFTRLQTLGVSKPQELLVSMLLKMGYTPSQIAVLSAHSVSSITNTRKNLYKKVTGEDGKAEDWDKIVNTL